MLHHIWRKSRELHVEDINGYQYSSNFKEKNVQIRLAQYDDVARWKSVEVTNHERYKGTIDIF